MLPTQSFVHIKFLILTLRYVEKQFSNPLSFHFFLISSSVLLILCAMNVFIKGLVGFWYLKTNILLALNSDLLWEVTFQDIIYFSMFVTCFQRGFFSLLLHFQLRKIIQTSLHCHLLVVWKFTCTWLFK